MDDEVDEDNEEDVYVNVNIYWVNMYSIKFISRKLEQVQVENILQA